MAVRGGSAALAAFLALALAPQAKAQDCGELWYRRNAIYKEAGYCFRTGRAIQTFGNAGCQYDDVGDVPLSARQRRVVDDITAAERELGCR